MFKLTSGLICTECQNQAIQFYNFKKAIQPNLECHENTQRTEVIKKLDMFLEDNDFDEELSVLRYQQCFTVVPSCRRSLMQNFQSWQPRVHLTQLELQPDELCVPEAMPDFSEQDVEQIYRRPGPKSAVQQAVPAEFEDEEMIVVEQTQDFEHVIGQSGDVHETNPEGELPIKTEIVLDESTFPLDAALPMEVSTKVTKPKPTKEQRDWANETAKACYSIEETEAGATPIWTCVLCTKVYVSAAALRLHLLAKHLSAEDPREPLSADEKHWVKNETRDKRILIETIDGNKFEWICDICNFTCTSHKTFRIHLIETHIKMIKPIMSGFSDKKLSYYQQSWIQSQIKREHAASSWKCQKCFETFKTEKSFRQHLHEEHVLKFTEKEMKSICISTPRPRRSKAVKFQWTCKECFFQFSCQRFYDAHIKLHETLKSVSPLTIIHWCNECNMFFRSDDDLMLHSEGHADDLSVLMAADGIALQKTVLFKRLTVPEEAQTGRFTCGHCGRKLNEEIECKNHILIHHVNPLVCPKDGREFRAMQPYVCHLQKVHSELLPASLLCAFCKQPFDDVYQRLQHMKTCDSKKFTCDNCGKKFASKPSLHNHLKREMGMMSCECPLCGKTCKTKDELRIHNRSHTKEVRFRIVHCGH